MKRLLMLLAAAMLAAGVGACSHHREKTKASNGTDRSSSIHYTDSLAFVSHTGDTLASIKVAVADEEQERNEGLMDVNHLPEDNGMLFVFDHSQPLSFWMANTPLPLDIIYVNKDKEIVRIHHNTKPYSQKNLKSGAPALYAIETNGGFCVNHDIQEGMKVSF